MKVIWLVSAGTGGHIFPALSLAEALKERGMKPVFAGRPRSMEQELVQGHGFEFRTLPSSGFFGKGTLARLQFGMNTMLGLVQAVTLLRRLRPAALVAAGGFGSVTPVLAAQALNCRYFMLEQNCIPGRVTRYLCRGAVETYLTFPLLRTLAAHTTVTGTPLRRKLLAAAAQAPDYETRLANRVVLVLGGSLGARALNFAAVDLARQLPDIRFVVQTGRRDYAAMQQKVSEAKLANIELIDFTLAMEELYARASLVLSRAGGMVINEILAFGLPSVLVPFPFATDNHQKANAQYVARQGATHQIDQSRLPDLSKIVKDLFAAPERLRAMAERACQVSRPDAANVIAGRIVRAIAPAA